MKTRISVWTKVRQWRQSARVREQPGRIGSHRSNSRHLQPSLPEFSPQQQPAHANAPETIGDVVPPDIKLSQLPLLAGKKVAQARSHLFFVKEGNDAIVLVSPDDHRIADVIH